MTSYPFPKASVQHRLGGRAVDLAMYTVTFGLGWIIWSLIVWGQGQTPGKQLLKLRVYDKTKGTPAKWGHMALREFALPLSISVSLLILGGALSAVPVSEIVVGGIAFMYLGLFILFFLDAFWIFKGEDKNRLVDVVVKTDVLNEAN